MRNYGRGGEMIVASDNKASGFFVSVALIERSDNQDEALIVARAGGRPGPAAFLSADFRR